MIGLTIFLIGAWQSGAGHYIIGPIMVVVGLMLLSAEN